MSLDVGAALQLAIAVSGRQNPLTTLQDLETLWGVYAAVKKAGKLDASAMVKDGSLQTVAGALARSSALLEAVLSDKTQGPAAIAFLESL